tara:strand:- start:563 stop:889 length:327 start_codon:yes stop_codon:yes gene_type:complete
VSIRVFGLKLFDSFLTDVPCATSLHKHTFVARGTIPHADVTRCWTLHRSVHKKAATSGSVSQEAQHVNSGVRILRDLSGTGLEVVGDHCVNEIIIPVVFCLELYQGID